VLIELTLLCYCRYRERRLRCRLEHYPAYLLKDMGLRLEGNRVVSDRDESTTEPSIPDLPPPPHPLMAALLRARRKRI